MSTRINPVRIGCLLAALCLVARPSLAQKVEHPLDPLSFQEYWAVLEVLRDAGHLDAETRFSIVNVREPPKELVWGWSKGTPFPRQAFALARQGPNAYEAVVDLTGRTLVSWTPLRDVQPNWLGEEYKAMEKEVKKNPSWIFPAAERGPSWVNVATEAPRRREERLSVRLDLRRPSNCRQLCGSVSLWQEQ